MATVNFMQKLRMRVGFCMKKYLENEDIVGHESTLGFMSQYYFSHISINKLLNTFWEFFLFHCSYQFKKYSRDMKWVTIEDLMI